MFLILIFAFLFAIIASGITTIPFSIPALVIASVFYKKSWIFFIAFLSGLFLDLYSLRAIGQTSLFLVILVLLIWLYERKFETQTGTFVFFATFLGSLIYLMFFGYNQVLIQSLVSALFGILLFRFLCHSERSEES